VNAVLPAAAENNATFGLRFSATLDSGSDDFYLDDVIISGMTIDPVLPPYTDVATTVVVNSNTATGENQPGWMFGRDVANATPFAFDDTDARIGDGALHVLPIGATPAQKFIGEYFFLDALADLETFSVDFKIGAGGDSSDANQVYFNVYANFGVSPVTKFYDCRYDVVATVGSTGSYTTLTFDPTQSYPVTTRGGASASPFACPSVPADMDTLSASSSIRAIAINLGDTSASDVGLDGYFDKAVVVATDDVLRERRTTTFDFEPTAPTCEVVITSNTQDFVEEKNNFAVLTWVHPAWLQEIAGSVADWIWGDDEVVNPTVAETQTFLKQFNWTGDSLTNATLTIASDNSHSVTLGSYATSSLSEFNYAASRSYDVTSGVVSGLNTLEIVVENFAWDTTDPKVNPAGLIYELTLTGTGEACGGVVPIEPVATVEMCKIDADTERGLSGWTLLLTGDSVDTVTVPVNTAIGSTTTAGFEVGASYVAVVSGTWLNDRSPEPENYVDAEYSTEDEWATYMNGFDGYGEDILELQVNGNFVDWGAYNGDHRYAYSWVATNTDPVRFSVSDSHYPDNSGSLTVTIYEGYAQKTGKGGCFILEDIPTGTYEASEIAQIGWEEVSGAGEYMVTDDTVITFANRAIPDMGTMLITKEVVGGTATVTDFAIMYRAIETEEWSEPVSFNADGEVAVEVPFGTYEITEVDYENYVPTYSESCAEMAVTGEGEAPICYVTNTYDAPLVCTPGENLLANGGFESPVVTNPGLWDTFTAGIDWVVDLVNPSTNTPSLEIQAGVFGWLPSEGSQYAELDGTEPNRISQLVPTIEGLTYTLQWDFSARPGTRQPDNRLGIYVDGDQVETNTAGAQNREQTNWRSDIYEFTGTGDEVEIAFADLGEANALGTLLDNVTLTCSPAPEYGPYCGDKVVNQEWEQCEVGQAGCTEYCRLDNQCQALTLVKIELEDTASPSFDSNIYLGTTTTLVPSGVWFPFAAIGDATAQSVALGASGLAVERDQVSGALKLAVHGDNDRGFDLVEGTVSIIGGEFGSLTRQITPGFRLEDANVENPRSIGDVWSKASSTEIAFAWRTYTARDGAMVEIITEDVPLYLCPVDEDGGDDEDTEVYRIEGNVWHDRDESGNRSNEDDDVEEFLGAWPVTATKGSTTLATTTDANGNYYFELEEGTWTITIGTEEDWVNTNPSTGQYVVTVPVVAPDSELSMSFFDTFLSFILPQTAHAATIVLATYTGYDFGLIDTDTNGGGGGGTLVGLRSAPTGEVLGASTVNDPVPQVLGASDMTIMPLGAPNTGVGGSVGSFPWATVAITFLFGMAYALHRNRAKS
jgi:hypothetical protein